MRLKLVMGKLEQRMCSNRGEKYDKVGLPAQSCKTKRSLGI